MAMESQSLTPQKRTPSGKSGGKQRKQQGQGGGAPPINYRGIAAAMSVDPASSSGFTPSGSMQISASAFGDESRSHTPSPAPPMPARLQDSSVQVKLRPELLLSPRSYQEGGGERLRPGCACELVPSAPSLSMPRSSRKKTAEEEEQEYLLNALEEVATDFEGGSAGTHTLSFPLPFSLSLSHTHPSTPSTSLHYPPQHARRYSTWRMMMRALESGGHHAVSWRVHPVQANGQSL